MTSQYSDMTSFSFFFLSCRVSLVKFSYWFWFNVNIMTSSGAMIIFIYKGLTRNLEIGNPLVWVSFAQYLELGRVRDTKFGTNVSNVNKMLPNAAKYQGSSYYHFWFIILKPKRWGGGWGGGGGKIALPPRLGLNNLFFKFLFRYMMTS